MKYYVGTYAEVASVNAQIDSNINLPNGHGTNTWAVPRLTTVALVYAIPVPTNGWNSCTYEEMTNGIVWPEVDEVDVQFPEPSL